MAKAAPHRGMVLVMWCDQNPAHQPAIWVEIVAGYRVTHAGCVIWFQR